MLCPILKACESNKSQPDAAKSIISQFIANLEIDSDSLSNIQRDPKFPDFLGLLYDILLEKPFPSPHEEEMPHAQVTILTFLTTLCLDHPDLLSLIATYTPLDRLIPIFFQRNVSNDTILDPQPSHLLYPIEFIAALSQSSQVLITLTSAIQMLFSVLISLVEHPQLSAYSIAAVAGFANNSATALSYLETMPNITAFKRKIASLLTSPDHNVMLASLASLCAIFSRSIDAETSMKVAFSALITPPSIPLSTQLSSSIILHLSQTLQLSLDDQEQLINSALKSTGMRAFILFRLINEIASKPQSKIFSLLQQPDFFAKYFNFIISTEDNFVAIAATHLLQAIFEESKPPILNESIEAPFLTSLKLIINNTRDNTIDKVSSALLILQIIIQSQDAPTYVLKMLQTNEDQVFFAFQRCIENTYSFAAVHFFLFLYNAAKFFTNWLLRLREIIVDSTFPALLVQCLSVSQNRRVISDSIYALSIIINGVKQKPPNLNDSLTDAVISGFLLINKESKKEKSQAIMKSRELHQEYMQKIREIEVERDLSEKELSELKEISEISKTQNDFAQQKLGDLMKSYESLKQRYNSKKEKLKRAVVELKNSDTELQNLSEQLSNSEQEIDRANKKIQKLQTKMSVYQETEAQFSQLSETHADTEEKFQSTIQKLREAEEEIDLLQAKLAEEKKKKGVVDKLLIESQQKTDVLNSDVEKSRSKMREALENLEKTQILLKSKSDKELQITDELKRLREEISALKKTNDGLKAENEHYSDLINIQNSRIANLKKDKRELIALSQMIHKITNGQGIPEAGLTELINENM
ncbi:hypothetical protein TVAG_320820 [Trichomonas vaginalis G3]|uniref:Uncharacterized protein n=1 Tax=Trichomonas vaginalis (strain ATCC PRA-98 / G3) TaxID=412133 RepID=A2G9P8_TRIV3|nr:armadillo (ARM) repeat-containing protein family [Trichomonas vaginalis G3]EAX86121.1 hypothetical protein TVAG_320820 [Trichomonas vaginalis G3]KAI5548373.1 armadillo (ARM) repeat-containing protein family [Trichomonas vaginalis G3]|eukprot:XP_001299051.1 hypothetical protein [Trichomonas vaginalis G3]